MAVVVVVVVVEVVAFPDPGTSPGLLVNAVVETLRAVSLVLSLHHCSPTVAVKYVSHLFPTSFTPNLSPQKSPGVESQFKHAQKDSFHWRSQQSKVNP